MRFAASLCMAVLLFHAISLAAADNAETLLDLVRLSDTSPTAALRAFSEHLEDPVIDGDPPPELLQSYLLERCGLLAEARKISEPSAGSQLRIRKTPLLALTWALQAQGLTEDAALDRVLTTAQEVNDLLVLGLCEVVRGHRLLDQGDASGAGEAVRAARSRYASAVPDPAYSDWRSEMLRRRIEHLAALQELAARLVSMGPAIVAFQDADRLRAQGKIPAAGAAFDAALVAFPDHPIAAYCHLGRLRCDLAQDAVETAEERYGLIAKTNAWVAIQAALALGDHAAFLTADAKTAQQWWKRALSHVAKLTPKAFTDFPLAPALERQLLQEPRYLLESQTPVWANETPGRILHPDAPWALSELQLLLYARLCAVAINDGQMRQARDFADAALLYDQLAQSDDGMGLTTAAVLLQAAAQRGGFLLMPADLQRIDNPELRLLATFASLFDALYDWRHSSEFAGLLLKRSDGRDPVVTTLAHYLIGRAAYARAWREEAAAALGAIPLDPERGVPGDLWARAMATRFSLLHQHDETLEDAIASVDALIAHAPQHEDTAGAVLGVAMIFERRDPKRALRYLAILKQIAPKQYKLYPAELHDIIVTRQAFDNAAKP
jgi:hypothetical protein